MSQVTAIVIARDHVSYTLRAVASLLIQRSVDVEIVLVDQGSTDGTAAAVTAAVGGRVPLRVVRFESNQAYAIAANRGAVSARPGSAALLFLDNDAELAPGCLGTLLAALEPEDDTAAVGPKMLYPTGQIEEAGLVLPLWLVPFAQGSNSRGDDHRFNFPRDRVRARLLLLAGATGGLRVNPGLRRGLLLGLRVGRPRLRLPQAGVEVLSTSRGRWPCTLAVPPSASTRSCQRPSTTGGGSSSAGA